MSEVLKPCPFCGGDAEIDRYGSPRQSTIYTCTECGCTLETGEEWGFGSRWNTRADSPALTLLRTLEWSGDQRDGFARCVSCGNKKDEGHRAGCGFLALGEGS